MAKSVRIMFRKLATMIVVMVASLGMGVSLVSAGEVPPPDLEFISAVACQDSVTVTYNFSSDFFTPSYTVQITQAPAAFNTQQQRLVLPSVSAQGHSSQHQFIGGPATYYTDSSFAPDSGTGLQETFVYDTKPPVGTNIVINAQENFFELSPATRQVIGEISFGDSATITTTVQDCEDSVASADAICHLDGRLDPYNCSAPVAIYLSEDDDGAMISVWRIRDDSTAYALYTVFEEDIPEPGIAPVVVVANGLGTLYLLPDGTLQMISPYIREPFKQYVLNFDLNGLDQQQRDIEPSA